MIAALLLMTSAATVVDAERAFAAKAQAEGQWTAFRATAAEDAIMFAPQPISAHELLKDRKDPPKSVRWWPTAAWRSCDGTTAVTTGGAAWPDGRHSYFTTIWLRRPDGWKWVLDHGDDLATPRSEPRSPPAVTSAACETPPPPIVYAVDGNDTKTVSRRSPDGTLITSWSVGAKGDRTLLVDLWDGAEFKRVLFDSVAAPSR